MSWSESKAEVDAQLDLAAYQRYGVSRWEQLDRAQLMDLLAWWNES